MLPLTGRARLLHHEILLNMPYILTHMTSYLGLECMPALRRLLLGFSKLTGVLKCSGLVRGSLSSVSLSIKCLSPFRHICVRFSVAMSPSSNTTKTKTEIYHKSFKNIQLRCKSLLGSYQWTYLWATPLIWLTTCWCNAGVSMIQNAHKPNPYI